MQSMNAAEHRLADHRLNERLATGGFRFTPQRRHVYNLLLEKRDHPTADEVFFRAKQSQSDVSMATVYNCLDALVQCGLVRQVQVDRGATRFCPNMHEHCHFYCETCGGIFDLDLTGPARPPVALPKGFQLTHFDLALRGFCPRCARKQTLTHP